MNNTFEYFFTTVVGKELDIDDIGNCCIRAKSSLDKEYILIIVTEYGFTTVIEYGPTISDINTLPDKVSYTYQRFDYNEGKINGIIEKFLNNSKYLIEAAEVVEFEEAKKLIRSMVDYL